MATQASPKSSRRWLRTVIGVVLAVLAVLLATRNPEPFEQLLKVRPLTIAALVGLLIVNMTLMALRLGLAIRQCGGVAGVPFRVWFRVLALGQFLNQVVPQLGNVYRAVTLREEYGLRYSTYAAGLFAFVWIDTMISAVIAMLVIAVVDPSLQLAGVPALAAVGGFWLAELVGPFVARRFIAALPTRRERLVKIQSKLTGLLDTAGNALRTPSFVLRLAGLNVLVTAVQMTALALCFDAVGVAIPLATLALYQVIVKFSNHVVITPGNLGVAELGWGVLGVATKQGMEQAIAAALLFRAGIVITTLGMGLSLGGFRLLKNRPQPLTDDEREADEAPADA